jgi:hypothetical protein
MGSHQEREPFELSNLLPAGVLAITLSNLDHNLPYTAFGETWATFDRGTAHSLHPLCSPRDIVVLESLSFLVEHEFARIASNFLPPRSLVLLRVYLTPYDLPGVQGRLMNRQEHILGHYKRSMREILPNLINDIDYWRGAEVLPPNPSLFLPPSLVGVFVDPIKFGVVYNPSPGLEDLSGDIQRTSLPGA